MIQDVCFHYTVFQLHFITYQCGSCIFVFFFPYYSMYLFTTSPSTLMLTEETQVFYSCTRTVRLLLAPLSTRLPPTSLIMAPMGWWWSFRKETRLMCTWKPNPGSGPRAAATSVLLLSFCCTVYAQWCVQNLSVTWPEQSFIKRGIIQSNSHAICNP